MIVFSMCTMKCFILSFCAIASCKDSSEISTMAIFGEHNGNRHRKCDFRLQGRRRDRASQIGGEGVQAYWDRNVSRQNSTSVAT